MVPTNQMNFDRDDEKMEKYFGLKDMNLLKNI